MLPLYYAQNKDGEIYLSTTYPTYTETNFPDAIDTMIRMSDLDATTKPLADEYYAYVNAGNFTSARQLLIDNPNLEATILNAAKINKSIDATLALENWYKDDIKPFFENRFANKGEYNASTTYFQGNVISLNGECFICRVETSVGVSPTAHTTTTNWAIIAQQGIQGVSGTGLAPRGTWNSSTTYYVNDCIADNNSLWQCLIENTNSEPTSENTNWSALIDLSILVCSEIQPTSQSSGSIWLQIL